MFDSIFKVDKLSYTEMINSGPEYWKSKLYEYNLIVIDDITLSKEEFVDVSVLFGVPWGKDMYDVHKESVGDLGVVNWSDTKGLKKMSLPWHQDNP